jgi:spore germination cell wall hydrolase CwlJ-like protein
MARVAYAEAGDQGESGLAAVVYTIMNRLADGRWGRTVESVVDAPGQFEPVMRAGGTWRRLRPVTPVQEATVRTIVDLALQGRLPDPTGGARYFQNEAIVASRVAAGIAPPGRLGFAGATPTARIGAHTFYTRPGTAGGKGRRSRRGPSATKGGSIFFDDSAFDPPGAPAIPPPSEARWPSSSR